jgi:secreted Zn-dependent insulinase-like peptidase
VFSSAATTPLNNFNIEKSPNDQKQYVGITLKNKLEVLLISDPNTDKASAAMDVFVGSADDPAEFLGLAHFLEHMLFLGTEKYPTPDEYQKFISNHGGSHNAFTSIEHTNYFFDIEAEHLEQALDRFAQQFTAPLFNADYVEREVNAVHSEFTAKLKDDGRRFFEALKTTLSADHPYSKFSVGNLETLKSTPEKSLRDALLDFYHSHYSANQMKLVILGKEPIDTLRKWAISKFSDIPNKDIVKRVVDEPFFAADALPKQINIQTLMDKRNLTLAFPIPSDVMYTTSKPLNYIANLIGHEGKGSLLSKLKELDLVDSLSAGSEFDTRVHALFMINMSLTKKGLENYDKILDTVFDYIDLLKKEGIRRLYFEEQVTLLDIAFKFLEKSEPIHYTSSLANSLQVRSVEKVLSEPYELNVYDPELYLNYVNKLTPDNLLIALTAQDVPVENETQWYKTPYKTFKLSDDLISSLNQTRIHKELFMPEPNEFIPESTHLLPSATKMLPEKLKSSEGFEIWYASDASFGTPKANIFLSLRSPLSNSSADHYNKTDILVSLLKDLLNEYSYPAFLAGLHFELYQHMRGITVKISGYNDKQGTLLLKILKTLKYGTFNKERFLTTKERLKRQLENARIKKPFEQAINIAQDMLIVPSWNEEERLQALDNLELVDINSFRELFLEKLQSVMLVNGNITRATSLTIASQVEAFILNDAAKTEVERGKIIKLSGKEAWLSFREVSHPDTGYLYYVQGEDNSYKEQAKMLLLNQILSTEFYADIRTDKQMGYIVFSTNFTLLDIPAIAFVIQSPNTALATLLDENKRFLNASIKRISELNTTELERYKQAVSVKLLQQDNTLYSVSNKYWQDIDRKNYDFNTNEALAKTVMELNIDDLLSSMSTIVENPGKHFLTFTSADTATSSESIKDFKALSKSIRKDLSVFR